MYLRPQQLRVVTDISVGSLSGNGPIGELVPMAMMESFLEQKAQQ